MPASDGQHIKQLRVLMHRSIEDPGALTALEAECERQIRQIDQICSETGGWAWKSLAYAEAHEILSRIKDFSKILSGRFTFNVPAAPERKD